MPRLRDHIGDKVTYRPPLSAQKQGAPNRVGKIIDEVWAIDPQRDPPKTAIDCAHTLRDLSDVHFPDAAKIVLVQDNLNTHKPASLYEAFPAAEARRLVERFEWHYTSKHGSWLDRPR